MKTLRVSLMALALSIGMIGSFAFSAKAPAVTDPTYTWQHFDRSGNPIGAPVPNLTVTQARSQFGCPGTVSLPCATAVGAPTIYYN